MSSERKEMCVVCDSNAAVPVSVLMMIIYSIRGQIGSDGVCIWCAYVFVANVAHFLIAQFLECLQIDFTVVLFAVDIFFFFLISNEKRENK